MCGIAGFVGAPGVGLTALRGWGELLEHRGPDDVGLGVLAPAGFGSGRDPACIGPDAQAVLWHRRLSILDLSPAGWQPMSSPDGRHHLILNGEIYNYLELRAELESHGVTFRSRSDTEVLLAAWRHWGEAVLPRLTGMFAFALLDTQERRLTLARDPFGIKPLLWWQGPGAFAFASETKALLALPQVCRRVDPQRVYDYLRFGRERALERIAVELRKHADAPNPWGPSSSGTEPVGRSLSVHIAFSGRPGSTVPTSITTSLTCSNPCLPAFSCLMTSTAWRLPGRSPASRRFRTRQNDPGRAVRSRFVVLPSTLSATP